VLLVLAAAACGHGSKGKPSSASSSTARTVPVDSVRPGEIAEGKDLAFGFPLPRAMHVKARFPDAVIAAGELDFEPLTNYVRERVDTGPVTTVFAGATLKTDPKRRLLVEVRAAAGMVELVVRDETPKPIEPGLSDEERWKRSGLGPDGSVLPSVNE
jgi:hypothetical protein